MYSLPLLFDSTDEMVLTLVVKLKCSVFGTYLLENLGPVERETVRWGWILVVRAIDVTMGGWIWNLITPLKLAKKGDGGEHLFLARRFLGDPAEVGVRASTRGKEEWA